MAKKLVEVLDYHHVGDVNGNWTRVPGRLAFAMELQEQGPYGDLAKRIIEGATRLKGYRRESIEKRLAAFLQAHYNLNEYLHTPLGDIPLKVENTRIRNLWHTYLIAGRELIDEVGFVIHICFSLKQGLEGLNEKKFASLRRIIEQAKSKVPGLEPLETCISLHEPMIIAFVSLRNRDKTKGDTIVDLPWISDSGIPTGGIVADVAKGLQCEFVGFVNSSHLSLIDFVKRILGAEKVT